MCLFVGKLVREFTRQLAGTIVLLNNRTSFLDESRYLPCAAQLISSL
jgi:hypothetical protein